MALPSLEGLLESRHAVVAVVTQPDRGRGRGRKRSPSPVGELALAKDLTLLRPEVIGDSDSLEALQRAKPDLGVVVAFGQFIPKPIRCLPSLGYLINAHASLLPKYRGASPVAQAILDGEKRTGVSIMRVEREMDAGPVALTRSIEIGEEETTGELTDRLAALAAEALLEALDAIAEDQAPWTEQDPALASLAPKIARADGRIDWKRDTATCVRRIHAMAPRPGAFTRLPDEGDDGAGLRILRARPYAGSAKDAPQPGQIRLADQPDAPPLRIGTADGWLVPLEVQRPGGKAMDPAAFLRGYPLQETNLLAGTTAKKDEA